MYAVVATGGKQYRVAVSDILRFEKLDAKTEDTVVFDKVLLVVDGENVKMGSPYINDLNVYGEVLGHGRGKKIEIIKFKRRKHHMKRMGHRQDYTEVKITGIGEDKRTVTEASEVKDTEVQVQAKKDIKEPKKATKKMAKEVETE